jgi:hypothetical protein
MVLTKRSVRSAALALCLIAFSPSRLPAQTIPASTTVEVYPGPGVNT